MMGSHGWRKRGFDAAVAAVGLLVTFPLMAIVAVLVRATSPGPALFAQVRIGRHGRPFRCLKFRTMFTGGTHLGTVTTAVDPRITRVGRVLRRAKLDELPQLWNVLVGDMALVGPRPDVPGYADRLTGADRAVLDLRPGITGPATLLFRDEERLLAGVGDPRRFNDEVVFPEKIRINLDYAARWSFVRDLGFIVATVAPEVSRRLGLNRRLGLGFEAFQRRMEVAAGGYRDRR
jgi:lipopolysaccharide/colanic/teichoic acid biosynthesis glycosyltransferase